MYGVEAGLLLALGLTAFVRGQDSINTLSFSDNKRQGGFQLNLPDSSHRTLDSNGRDTFRPVPNDPRRGDAPVNGNPDYSQARNEFTGQPQGSCGDRPDCQQNLYTVSISNNNRGGGVQVNLPDSSHRTLDLNGGDSFSSVPNARRTNGLPVEGNTAQSQGRNQFTGQPNYNTGTSQQGWSGGNFDQQTTSNNYPGSNVHGGQQPNYNLKPSQQGWTGSNFDQQTTNNNYPGSNSNSGQQPNYNQKPSQQGWAGSNSDQQATNNYPVHKTLIQTIGSNGELTQVIKKGEANTYAAGENIPRKPQQATRYETTKKGQEQPRKKIQWDRVSHLYKGKQMTCYCPKRT